MVAGAAVLAACGGHSGVQSTSQPAAAVDYISAGEFGSGWPLTIRTIRIQCEGTTPLVVAGGKTYRLTNASDMSAIRAVDRRTGKQKDLRPLKAVGVHDCAH